MFVPIRYTTYKNSKLATFVSIFGALFYAGGFFTVATMVLEAINNNSGTPADIGEAIGGILAGVVLIGIGWLINKWAEKIAEKKLRKDTEAAMAAYSYDSYDTSRIGGQQSQAPVKPKSSKMRTAGIILLVLQAVAVVSGIATGSSSLQISGSADLPRLLGYFTPGIIGVILLGKAGGRSQDPQ